MRRHFPCLASALLLAALMSSGCVIRIERPAPERVAQPGLMPDTSGLDDYQRHRLFASRQIEEGDFGSALEELQSARDLRDDDPGLFEMLGIAYDGDRQPGLAYENFLRAGEMYLGEGDLEKAWRMLGWLGTFDQSKGDARAEGLEKELRDRQEALNSSD